MDEEAEQQQQQPPVQIMQSVSDNQSHARIVPRCENWNKFDDKME
jgi:hypothetical protein